MSQLLQTLLLWPLFWVALGIAFSRFFASRAMMASGVGLLVGVLVTVRVVGTPSPETYLSAILAWPLLGAAVILFMPRQWTETIRRLSVLWLWAGFVLSLWLLGPVVHASLVEVGLSGALRRLLESAFFGDYALAAGYDGAGYRFVEHRPWIPDFGITYKVGVDGISLWLLILTTLLSPLSLIASWNSIDNKVKEYAFSFLLLTVGMLGAFLALDLFLFYVFWELMLVPMYLIIGIWGGTAEDLRGGEVRPLHDGRQRS
jgi:NADH-quinone oxidoreductase subunit M